MFTKISVVRCARMSSASRSYTSIHTSPDMIASSGEPGSSSVRSRSRAWPSSITVHGASVTPVRNRVIRSIGFVVAEMPTRVGGRSHSASSRSSDSARCAPRLLPASAWISSTITVRTVRSIFRPDSVLSRMYSDSGVVTRMCGGCGASRARSLCGVSPVRTAARIGAEPSMLAANSRPMPSSGARRFFSMSFDSAFSGETYRICVSSRSVPSAACFASRSMTPRNAASVLPEPVGALISVCVPPPIASHAFSCTPVGAVKAALNQPATAGWKFAGSMGLGLLKTCVYVQYG